MSAYDIIGIVGTAIIIVAYFGTQQGWLRATDWRFPFANLIGAALILFSLWFDWNLPSVVMEVFWMAISLYGLWRIRRMRRG